MRYSVYLLVVLFLSPLFMSCDKFLDKSPDDRMTIKTLQDIDAVMADAYNKSRTHSGLHFATDDVTLTDGVTIVEDVLAEIYSWEKDITDQTQQDNPAEFWRASYLSISNCNLALSSIETLDKELQASEHAQALKAEALIARAYFHFMILNTFAPRYEEANAATALGIPYVTELENKLVKKYTRLSVQSSYDLIIKDYEEGIKLLEESYSSFNKNKYRITVPTAYAIGSRIYLWRAKNKDDFKRCIALSTKSIDAFGGVNMMRKWSEYATDLRGIVEVANAEVGWVQDFSSWQSENNIYQMTTTSYNSFGEPLVLGKDLRRNGIFYKRQKDIKVPAGYFIIINSDIANDLMPLSEPLLNMIEAKVQLDDLVGAHADMVDFLKSNHNPPYDFVDQDLIDYYSVAGSPELSAKEAWIEFILSERRRQYHFKGIRWYDIHRYKIDITHMLLNGEIIHLKDKLPLFCFEIPQYAIINGLNKNY